jgi:carbon-monoxide dehydrogenase medium subunit
MTAWKQYYIAKTIQDALQTLSAGQGSARPIAGGTDLLLDLQQGRQTPLDTLVDLTQIPELTALEVRASEIYIGAAVPLSKIVASASVRHHALALSEACGLVGGPQVRNTATLGGNVAHALPAGDGTIALLALDAQAEIASSTGIRRVAMGELFLGPGRSALDMCNEILLGFYLPLAEACQSCAHRRVMRPQGVAIAILNMAVWVSRQGELIKDIRIALGPAGPVPLRARETEAYLRGKIPGNETLEQAIQILLLETSFRTSPHRATAAYRQHLAGVLLKDAFFASWQRTS